MVRFLVSRPRCRRDRPFGTLREQAVDAAGVVEEAARHFSAGADAEARHRHVGRADARIQRGSGVLVDHLAGNVLRAPPHDLRVLRQVRRGQRAGDAGVRRAHRARRNVAGRRLRRAQLDESRDRRGRRPPGRALGRRAVDGAQAGDRRAQAEGDRHRSVDDVRVQRRPVERRAAGDERGARRGVDARGFATPSACRSSSIASRLPEEEAFFEKMTALVWQMTQTMFSDKVIVPGTTHTSDLVWWWRQRTNDQGLGTWFQPSIEVQRKGVNGRASSATIRSSSLATSCTATSASPSRA